MMHPAMLISVSASLRLFQYGCFFSSELCLRLFPALHFFRYGYFPARNYVCGFFDAVSSGMGLMHPAMLISLSASLRLFRYRGDASTDGNLPARNYVCGCSGTVFFPVWV